MQQHLRWKTALLTALIVSLTKVLSFHSIARWSQYSPRVFYVSPTKSFNSEVTSGEDVGSSKRPSRISKSKKINKEIVRFFNQRLCDVQLQKLKCYVYSIESDMNQINVSFNFFKCITKMIFPVKSRQQTL